MVAVKDRLTVSPRGPSRRLDGRMQKFIVGKVRTIEEVRRGATHKVGSRKSAGRIDPLQASAGGGILYPTVYNMIITILDYNHIYEDLIAIYC